VGGELVGHRVLGDLPDVVEEVLADGQFDDLLEMEGLAFAPQDFQGGLREGHEFKPGRVVKELRCQGSHGAATAPGARAKGPRARTGQVIFMPPPPAVNS
jgi:hypothetical protein